MQAAVLHTPGEMPRAEAFADPDLRGDEISARVLAAGLHQLVRVHATNRHYTSHGTYPMVPGVDGVAELPDGRRVYFTGLRAPYGSFAERAAISPSRAVPLPDGVAPEHAAALVNPASSSWLALRLRAPIEPGQIVLVLGATGTSGQLAVQIARALGAGRIIAAGRNADVLARLPADLTLRVDAPDFPAQLTAAIGERGVDIVLDYLWGAPAEATLHALLACRHALTGRRIRYVDIGQSAGDHIHFSPHALRSLDLHLLGSGIGSVPTADIAREVPHLLARARELTIAVDAVPLARVGEAWAATADAGRRVVIVP